MTKALVFPPEGNSVIKAQIIYPEKTNESRPGNEALCLNGSDISSASIAVHKSDQFQDCGAFIWVSCTAQITSPPYIMAVPNATDSHDGLRRAKLCKGSEVISATWHDPAVAYCVDNVGVICNA